MGQRSTPIINAFTAGELSGHLAGRTDHEKYYSGCRRLENFIPRPHGSVFKRPGMRFVAAAKHPTRAARLVSFDFNGMAGQSYVIEMGHEYLRFFTNGGAILDSGTGEPYEVEAPWAEDQVWDVQIVQSADVMYLVHPETQPRKLTRTAHDAWTLTALEFKWPGFDWAIVDSSGDGKRSGKQADTFQIPDGEAFSSGHMVDGETQAGTACKFMYIGSRTVSAIDGAVTCTFKDSPTDGQDEIESVCDSSGDVDTVNWKQMSKDHTRPDDWATDNWPGVVAMYEDRLVLAQTPSKPLTLWLSKTGAYEDFRMNTSPGESGVQGTPLDDDAIEITLSGSRVNPIRWIVDEEELLVGTNGSEIKVWSGVDSEGMTPSKYQRKRQSAHGSASMAPVMAEDTVLFVSRHGKKLRGMAFDFARYRYVSPEKSLLAEHVFSRFPVVDMDYAREPDGVLWAVRGDGVLCGCTFLPSENVTAWHRHPLGGGGAAESVACIPGDGRDETWVLTRRTVNGTTARHIERMDPNFEPNGKTDAARGFFVDCGLSTTATAVTAISQASAASVTAAGHGLETGDRVRLEDIEAQPSDPTAESTPAGMESLNDRVFTVAVVDENTFTLDADTTTLAAYYSGGEVLKMRDEVSGLDHLEGRQVQILADGSVVDVRTVAGGKVSLPKAYGRVHVGLGYSAVLQPMRLEAGSAFGTSQTKKKRIMGASIRFLDSVGGKVCPGDDDSTKYEIVQPHVQPAKTGAPPQLHSLDRELKLSSSWDRAGLLTVRQDDPLPMTIICVVPGVQGGDE